MARVARHPLDERLGFGHERIDWTTSGTSRQRAVEEAPRYSITQQSPTAYVVQRLNDAERIYDVRLEAGHGRGWCSCEAFRFQTMHGKGPCVHLWIVHIRLPPKA